MLSLILDVGEIARRNKQRISCLIPGFLELMSRYHISVDQILHGEAMEGKSTERMQFETLLDELTDAEIKILTATAQALLDARADSEGEN